MTTRSINLAAWLNYNGYNCQIGKVEDETGKEICVFSFQDSEEIERLREEYRNVGTKVLLQDYLGCFRDLKTNMRN